MKNRTDDNGEYDGYTPAGTFFIASIYSRAKPALPSPERAFINSPNLLGLRLMSHPSLGGFFSFLVRMPAPKVRRNAVAFIGWVHRKFFEHGRPFNLSNPNG